MPTHAATVAPASPVKVELLLARFDEVRAATLAFVAPLSAEDMMVQSSPDASPAKWHLAHSSWFFEAFVLGPYAPGYQAFNPDFAWLFNSYYNALGDMPAKNLRASFSRPPLAEIMAYRAWVDAAVRRLLGEPPADSAHEVIARIALGLEHEQQHLELLATDIKLALWTNPLHPAYRASEADQTTAAAPLAFVPFPGGLVEIGVSPDAGDPLAFAFDNETPRHTVFLAAYELATRLVTAAEYLAFINDEGYSRPELWLSEGWATMRREGWQAPLYWSRDPGTDTGWQVYTLAGFVPLETLPAAPVCHVSFFEADAFARWAGHRLPTEFEWEHAATQTGSAPGEAPRRAAQQFDGGVHLESGAFHPRPAKTGERLGQLFGDAWEWTASPYTGYPGYRPLPGALGEYNGKFMSSQIILRGGSCVTPASHIRATYRNFFPPATRWQFSGIRLARDPSSGHAR